MMLALSKNTGIILNPLQHFTGTCLLVVKPGTPVNSLRSAAWFRVTLCSLSSCLSCCCGRDYICVPPPGSTSASAKAGWPVSEVGGHVGGGVDEKIRKELVRPWPWVPNCHTDCIHGLAAGRPCSAMFCGGSRGGCENVCTGVYTRPFLSPSNVKVVNVQII